MPLALANGIIVEKMGFSQNAHYYSAKAKKNLLLGPLAKANGNEKKLVSLAVLKVFSVSIL